MGYPDSVQYLYALGNEIKTGAKLGLERMQSLLEGLQNPERRQSFVHVAGTNGKGSTCAMIASVLRHSGLSTGLYTSPHLIEPTERISINGRDVTEQDFANVFNHVHRVAEDLVASGKLDAHPSYFETMTAMALLLFKERCDMSVIEVGLGGRLDATNVITPRLTVITPVSYDHEAYLGNTIDSIAFEKAGILKPGVRLILATQTAQAYATIEKRARELGCPITSTIDSPIEDLRVFATGSRFRLDGDEYECMLPGRHQVENAKTAILAGKALGLSTDSIRSGLQATSWPGRLEFVARRPDFILDGAHNPAGAAALSSHIREFYPKRPVWIVYGAMRDKAVDEVAELLFPLADRLITTSLNSARALRSEAILELASHPNAIATGSIPEAIADARMAPPEAAVFFTGSLFLVGEVRAILFGKSIS